MAASSILDVPIDVVEATDAVSPSTCAGRVEFNHVTLSFGRGRAALEQVSFRAEPGEVLAIAGPSGRGKSTIADLRLRLLDPDEGAVRIDGVDLRRLDLRTLRRHVALVEQDPCRLHASMAENIRYSRPDATDAEVRLAARLSALEPFIAALPQGYDTIVGERGSAMSAGGVAIGADGALSDDCVDHGTAVMAAVKDHASGAACYAVRLFDSRLTASAATLIATIDWAIDARVHRINLSLGSSKPSHEAAFTAAVTRANAVGVSRGSRRETIRACGGCQTACQRLCRCRPTGNARATTSGSSTSAGSGCSGHPGARAPIGATHTNGRWGEPTGRSPSAHRRRTCPRCYCWPVMRGVPAPGFTFTLIIVVVQQQPVAPPPFSEKSFRVTCRT